jgi:hemolysin activation/secretion protein
MTRYSLCAHRQLNRTRVIAMVVLCALPLSGQGQDFPATDVGAPTPASSAVPPVSEPPAGSAGEPVGSESQDSSAAPTEPTNDTPAAAPAAPAAVEQTMPESSSSEPPPGQGTQEPSPEPTLSATSPAVIKGFAFSGNTVVTNAQLETVTQPFVGEVLDLPVLEKAAQSVTDYYRKQGYTLALSYVPQQEVNSGVVTLAVLEGTIGDITVSGNKHYSTAFIKRHFAQAEKEKVAKNESLERALLILNDYPNLKTSATLEAGKTVGATDVHVTVEDKRPVHFSLDLNNYGFNTISRYRFGAGAEIGNVLFDGGTLSVNAIWGNHPDQLLFGMGNYSVPIGGQGTKLVLGGSHGRFDVGGQLSFLNISGRTTIGDIAVTHPVIKSRFQNLLGEFGFSAKNNTLKLLDTTFGDDAIRLLKLGVNWDRLDLTGRWYTSVYGFQGLGEALGGMENNSPQATRRGADDRFTKGTMAAGRIQSLGHDVLLVLKGYGQITTGPVVVIEQMLLGGPDSVRGYQLGEKFVDQGLTLSAETRIPFFPSLMPASLKQSQGTVFFDYGTGSVRNPSPGEQRSTTLTGTGVGFLTLLPWYNANLRMDLGFPLGPKPIGGTLFGDRTPTLYFSISTRF